MYTHIITRPGMRALPATLIFACPTFYIFNVKGAECRLDAQNGKVIGYTVTRVRGSEPRGAEPR